MPEDAARSGAAMAPKERFTERAGDYRKARPGYPDETLAFLFSHEGLGQPDTLADVGSGTGKLTGQILAAMPSLQRVYAVEPNADMRREAESELGSDPRFVSVEGSGEATGLDGGSVDALTIAQAFHWFDFDRARAELQRVLRPSGRLALLWNLRLEDGDAFHRDYEHFLTTRGNGYEQVRATWQVRHELGPLFASEPRMHRSEVIQSLDLAGLQARLASSSYAPTEPSAVAELGDLFERHQQGGRVTMRYETVTYAGVVAPS